MKKLFALLLVSLLVFGTSVYGIDDNTITPGFRLGPGVGFRPDSGKYPNDPHKTFRMIRYVQRRDDGALTANIEDGGMLSEDSIVIWHSSYDDGVTVTTTTISSDSRVAGIIARAVHGQETASLGNAASDDVGKKNWTFLQTYGFAEVRLASTDSVSEGMAMGTSVEAGEATWFTGAIGDGGSKDVSTNQGNAGFFYGDASASATDVGCFLKVGG